MSSRLQAIATPLVANMDKVQIVPPPKDVDPRVLVWKGGSVLGKMDGVADLWLTPNDWVCFALFFAPSRWNNLPNYFRTCSVCVACENVASFCKLYGLQGSCTFLPGACCGLHGCQDLVGRRGYVST